jgi:ribosomal-protein-alanine N-acetyltransferase
MKPVVRSFAAADLPAVLEIERRSFPNSPWDKVDFRDYDCSVALWEGRLAGFLVSRQVGPAVGVIPAEREILNVAVDPLFRRLGVATALIQQEKLRKAVLYLEVRESNSPAKKLYEKLGFLPVGYRKDYYQFPTEAAVVMQSK